MEAKNVNIRDLQQLNDAIAYTMDAIQRISPQVVGLGHSPYGQIPFGVSPFVGPASVVDPFGAIRSSLEHAAFASRAAGNPLYAQGPYGIGPLGGFGLGHSPFGSPALANPALANPLLAAQLGALGGAYGGYGTLPYPGVRAW
jgi:hypothetical protein